MALACCGSLRWLTVDTTLGRQESCCFGYWFVPAFIMLITSTWSLRADCGWRDQRQRNVKFTQLQRKKNGIQNLSMSLLGCSPPDPDREVLKLLLPYAWNCWSSFPMSIQGSPKSCLIVMRSDWLKEPFWIPQRLTGFTLEMWECLKGRGVKPLHVTVSFPHSLESHWAPDCLSPVPSRHSSAVSIFSCVRHLSQWTS